MTKGEKLHALLSDSGSRQDVPSYFQKSDHHVDLVDNNDGTWSVFITK